MKRPAGTTHKGLLFDGVRKSWFWLRESGDRYLIWQFASGRWGLIEWEGSHFLEIKAI